jgi:hypothetical protein
MDGSKVTYRVTFSDMVIVKKTRVHSWYPAWIAVLSTFAAILLL